MQLGPYLYWKLKLIEQFSDEQGVTECLTGFHDTNNSCVDLQYKTAVINY